jgi:acetyl-CoA acyltransferase
MGAKLGLLAQIRPDFFAPELPAIAEFSTNETMGHSGNKRNRLFFYNSQISEDEGSFYLALELFPWLF